MESQMDPVLEEMEAEGDPEEEGDGLGLDEGWETISTLVEFEIEVLVLTLK